MLLDRMVLETNLSVCCFLYLPVVTRTETPVRMQASKILPDHLQSSDPVSFLPRGISFEEIEVLLVSTSSPSPRDVRRHDRHSDHSNISKDDLIQLEVWIHGNWHLHSYLQMDREERRDW